MVEKSDNSGGLLSNDPESVVNTDLFLELPSRLPQSNR